MPWHALPDGGGPDDRLEAALLVRDLRHTRAAWQRQRHIITEVPAGAALLRAIPGASTDPFEALLDVVAPHGATVAGIVALISADDRFGVVGSVQVEPHFLERLGQKPPPGWGLAIDGPMFSLEREQVRWVGRVDADGWLRVSDDVRWLGQTARTDPWVSDTLQTRLAGSDMAVVFAGDGVLVPRIAQSIPQPSVAGLAANVRHVALAWQSDGAKTGLWRLLVEADFLHAWPKAAPLRSVARDIDARAQGFAAVQLPPDWSDLLPMLLQNAAAASLRDAPNTFVEALRHLRGRLTWVDFGVPGDGALLAQSDSPTNAEATMPALRDWAKSHAGTLLTGAVQNFAMEPTAPGGRPALHMRPERGVEGPWLAAQGERVLFVQQRHRLERLLAAPLPARTLMEGPLTPLMRSTLAQERPFQSYWVLGGNGAWLDYLVWGAGHARRSWDQHTALQPVNRFLPQVLAIASYMWQRTYDVAVTADVSNSVLEVQLAHSEI